MVAIVSIYNSPIFAIAIAAACTVYASFPNLFLMIGTITKKNVVAI